MYHRFVRMLPLWPDGIIAHAGRMRWSVVVTAFACLAMPAVASAHAGNNDPTVLHVCIGNVSKVVRSVGVGGACISAPHLAAETPDHWRTKGDKGDQGLQGSKVCRGSKVCQVFRVCRGIPAPTEPTARMAPTERTGPTGLTGRA